mgnify:CR=1 FL=1
MEQLPRMVAVVGTNASGKSGLGVALAGRFGGEVISADSRQVYRGLDLGSGKLTERGGRWLKLLSGVVMLALGLVMLLRPDWLA